MAAPSNDRSLRAQAEERLGEQLHTDQQLSPEEAQALIHELQVHRIELEIQNEELRRTQERLAVAHDRYLDLYDFAPIGYVTVDTDGDILQANLTCERLLGLKRQALATTFHPLYCPYRAGRLSFPSATSPTVKHTTYR